MVPLGDLDPAFRMANGAPLTRDWMVQRTAELLAAADFYTLDALGQRVAVRASSWRAGGVTSATEAGLAGPLIMALGRWKSLAWSAYALYDINDLQRAAQRMWTSSDTSAPSAEVRVGNTPHVAPSFNVTQLARELRAKTARGR